MRNSKLSSILTLIENQQPVKLMQIVDMMVEKFPGITGKEITDSIRSLINKDYIKEEEGAYCCTPSEIKVSRTEIIKMIKNSKGKFLRIKFKKVNDNPEEGDLVGKYFGTNDLGNVLIKKTTKEENPIRSFVAANVKELHLDRKVYTLKK